MSPTSCQTAPPRARRDKDYSERREGVSTIYDPENPAARVFRRSSIECRPAETDHARPFRGFGLNPARKFLWRIGNDVESLFAEQLAHVLGAHSAHRLGADSIDYFFRNPGGRQQADPGQGFELRVAQLAHARHIGSELASFQGRH